MDKYAIKLSLYSSNNSCKINEWLQYHISLGIKIFIVILDINDIDLHNTIMFYSNFTTILINPTTDKYNNTIHTLELEINDFLEDKLFLPKILDKLKINIEQLFDKIYDISFDEKLSTITSSLGTLHQQYEDNHTEIKDELKEVKELIELKSSNKTNMRNYPEINIEDFKLV
jgi:hypothetical protein